MMHRGLGRLGTNTPQEEGLNIAIESEANKKFQDHDAPKYFL